MAEALETHVAQVLDRRLCREPGAPVAVGFSGGGDSLALLLLASAWAERDRRPLLSLTVDHGLQAASAEWARWCERRSTALGIPHRTLVRPGRDARPAAARRDRHALIANAAREAGAKVVLMGHTADDILETRLMRAGGARLTEPREWGPSPVWPEGRGVFLLRPLLNARRAALRAWLSGRAETWIEDPANLDLRSGRAEARRAIAAGRQIVEAASADRAAVRALASLVEAHPHGILQARWADLAAAGIVAASVVVATAAVCAGGGERLPRTGRAQRLAARIASNEPFVASLAGARIEATGETVTFRREPGARARRGADVCPILAPGGAMTADDLVAARFAGACGIIDNEAAIDGAAPGGALNWAGTKRPTE